MRLLTVRESYERGQSFTLYPLGDSHYGSKNCDVKKFLKTVDEIANDDNARWVGMGDMVESIAPNDKRWRAEAMDEEVVANQDRLSDYYVDRMGEFLEPIADKLWAYGDGNHEQKFDEHYYTNLSVRILERIGRPERYSGWAGMTRVQFSEGTHRSALTVFHAHGWQSGRLDGAKVNELDHLMGYIDGCDIYLQGHSHATLIKTKTKLEPDWRTGELRARTCFGAHTGSFLRTYAEGVSGYSERAQYPPTQLGTVKFRLYPEESGVRAEGVQ